jgi:hypothetical protein
MRQLSNDLGTGAISLPLVKIVSGQCNREGEPISSLTSGMAMQNFCPQIFQSELD